MASRYLYRLLLLLQLTAFTDTDQCHMCSTPMVQNDIVPWRNLLNNTMHYFLGSPFRNMIQFLPKNSFVAGPSIQVCIIIVIVIAIVIVIIIVIVMVFAIAMAIICVTITIIIIIIIIIIINIISAMKYIRDLFLLCVVLSIFAVLVEVFLFIYPHHLRLPQWY